MDLRLWSNLRHTPLWLEVAVDRGPELDNRDPNDRPEILYKMTTYLEDEDDPLDGFEFLTMAEAGEVGHLKIVQKLNERAGNQQVAELVEWALPIQERHFQDALDGSLELAGQEDPNETES